MPSSHSSSSHSSSSFSGSSHSSSSHSSGSGGSSYDNLSSSGRSAANRRSTTHREYEAKRLCAKRRITGYNHTYRYFDISWEDKGGTTHIPGYYDENNNRYDGVYSEYDKSVICHCSYCGNATNFDLSTTKEFECKSCGAPMDIVKVEQERELYLYDNPNASRTMSNGGCTPYSRANTNTGTPTAIKVILSVIMAIIFIASNFEIEFYNPIRVIQNETRNNNYSSGKSLNGHTAMYLTPTELEHCYTYSFTPTSNYEIALRWDGENYYDNVNNYYVWHNEDVSPAMWQYWSDSVGNNYGNYGWMEYDETTREWFVEVSKSKWEVVPSQYDTSTFYYIIDSE